MPVIPDLFEKEIVSKSKIIPDLFPQETPKSSLAVPNLIEEPPKNKVVIGLFGDEKPKFSFLQEAIVKPVKTFYGGTLKAAANLADTLDFYSDKISQKIGIPETKESIFEYLRDNWTTYGERLQKEGLSEGIIKKIYSGLGEAGFEIPKFMSLGPQGLVISGALESGKQEGIKGAVKGAVIGGLTKGMLKGINILPTKVKLPVAFGAGAVTTPGGLEEKVAGGTIFAGLSAGKGPTMQEFKETQSKYSPLVKGFQKVLPYESRERIYQNYINRMQSIENIVEKAQDLGAKILPGENSALRATAYLSIGQKVKTVLDDKTYKINPDGTFTFTGEGLKPILDDYDRKSPTKGRNIRNKDLNDYLIAQRTIKDLQRPKSEFTEENIVTPEQVKKAQDTLNNLTQKHGGNISHFEQTAARLYDYQKRVLHILVDSGNMSQEQYDTIISKNPNYVPFDRIIEGVDTAGTPISKNRFTGARSFIKRIKGSELEIHNPIESMIKNTYRIMDIAERNTVARGVAKLTEVLPEAISPVKISMVPVATIKEEITPSVSQIEPIFRPSQFKPKGNVIEYFDNGKRSYMKVTPNLYQAMTGLNETSASLLTKILSIPAGTLRTGATITPEFMLRNPIRDQWTAFMQTKLGFKPFVDASGAIADIMGKSETYYDWLRSGGAYSGFVELSRPNLQKQLNILKGNSSLLSKLNIITKAQDISQLFEQATRLAVYKAGIKKGLTPVEAGFGSREATVDFARRGAKTKDINSIIAFFNAGIQGTDKLVRTAKEDPVGFAVKGIVSITIPSIISYALNRDDPDYKELPRWQKDLFWIYKMNGTFVRIPKPFAYGQLFGSSMERFLEYLDTQDPKAFDGFKKSLYDSLTPSSGDPTGSLMATGIKPLIENATNWSFFRERPIVSQSQQRLLPREQYGPYTSEVAKLSGRLLNYSPAKIENLTQGLFGGTGRYGLEAGDILLRGIRKIRGERIIPERPADLADFPLVKGFVTRPAISAGAESIQEFYLNREKLSQVYNTYKNFIKQGDKEKALELKQQYPNLNLTPIFNNFAENLSNYTSQIERVSRSEKYTDKQKKELIKEIEKKMVETAKKANDFIKNKSKVIPNLFD